MRMNQYLLSITFILLSFSWSFGQDPDVQEGVNTNMKFYHIDVEVSLDTSYIKGSVYCEFVAIREDVTTMSLDLADQLKVSKIDGAKEFSQKDNQLLITLNGSLKAEERSNIKIYYEGAPKVTEGNNGVKKGLIYSTHGKNKNPVIASVCYPNGGFLWFPCKKGLGDKVDSIYIDITIEDKKVQEIFMNPKTKEEEAKEMPIIAVSNGLLEGIEKVGENKKKYQWRHRHRIAPHHVLLAISNFMKAESEFKGKGYKFPINFYLFPEKFKESSSMMNRVPQIMACLTNTFGPYPYKDEVFNITQVGIELGMDGMPTQTNVLLEDMKATHMYTAVHQMASMWFGNHISPKEWQDAWITEALATYAEAMWQEFKRGLNVYQIILDEKEYFEGGKLFLEKREDYSEERLSKKGMYAIHMLRGIMGDTYFFQTLKAITSGQRVRGNWSRTYLSTENFQEICEYYASENIERDYTNFFQQWIHGEYYPTFRVSYSVSGGKVQLTVDQEKKESNPEFFTMPLRVEIELEDGTILKETLEDYNQAKQTFEIPVSGSVKNVQFDPSNWIFKDLKYVRYVTNEKLALQGLDISTSNHRRKLKVTYEAPKKQDVTIQLFEVANGISLKEDKELSTQTFKKVSGAQSHEFKIPLGFKSRGVYRIEITAKGETYSKILRLKRVVEAF